MARFDARLQFPQQSAEHVVMGNLVSEHQTLHRVVVGQQSDQILQKKALAVLEQLRSVVNLNWE